MYENLCSPKAQAERCDRAAETVTGYLLKHVSPEGEWDEAFKDTPIRERLYFALSFLRSGQEEAVRRANRLIQRGTDVRCHFSPMIALQLLTKYDALLEEGTREWLDGYVRNHMQEFRKRDLDYVGVNDNFPSMATYTLIMGGQFLKEPELAEQGKERLKQFRALFTRRGTASEYNSPTYSSIQLLAMAELANHAEDEEVREIALGCETRIWADLFGHLHRETSQIAGPYSRAYSDDSAGYTGLARSSLYALLGDELPVNIFNTILETEDGCRDGFSHNGSAFGQINTVWFLDTVYECPEELIDLALHKQYPYEMWGTTEFTSSTDSPAMDPPRWPEGELSNYEYPAGNGKIYTYMKEDYAMGTATHEFHNGIQTDSFHILYRRTVPALRQKDIGAVYARYLVNEKSVSPEMVLLEDEGRKIGVQHKNTAMVLYKPKAILGKEVHSLKLSLVIPRIDGQIGEVWLGDQRMEGESLVSRESCTVYIQDGPVYMAFQPLLLTDYGRENAVAAKWENGFLIISFYNYTGPARDFSMKEMLLTGNGFLAQVSSRTEAGSFEDFRQTAAGFDVQDEWQSTIHSRFSTIRRTRCRKGELEFSCEYSPVTEGIKHITVNGQPLPEDKLYMSGFDCSKLPFLA